MAYDSTYSAINAVNSALGYEALKYDSTYDAALALLLNLGGEDKGYDSLYSIMVELARMAENGEIGSSDEEISLVESITENGQNVYTPEEGYVYSSVEITVDVHPTEKLVQTITENGTYNYTGEYKDAEIVVDAGVDVSGNIDITANGAYDVSTYATASVNVPNSGGTNYSYKIGMADEAGLRAIGWDDESIGMYRDNNLQYVWRVGDFTVSQANKDLAEGFTKDEISNNKSNPDFVYCPMFDTSNVTDMGSMFNNCSSLQYIPLFDTSNVTNMNSMFTSCSSLQSIPLLDTSNVTSINSMFSNCSNLTTIPQLDTSKVMSMSWIFNGCSSLQSIPQLDTSNVTDMIYMFNGCSSLQFIPQLETSKVNSMNSMFYNCSNLQSIPQLDTSKVSSMSSMFNGCSKLTIIPLLDAGSVTTTTSPFGYYSMDRLVDIGGFKKLKVSWTSYFLDKAPNATVESLMNVINNLWDWTDYPDGNAPLNDGTIRSFGTTHKLVFGTTNLAKLTEDQIAVATNKGWTLT